MDENKVVPPNGTEGVAPEATETETVEETVEEVKSRLAKAEELANNYKIRAEKAEKGNKTKVETPSEKKSDLGSKDIIALMNAKVAEEDIDEVVDYAKFKKISVTEALKTSTIKTTLNERAEQRKTAEATSTGNGRRTSAKLDDATILENARKGNIPQTDAEIERLVDAKWNTLKSKKA